jgi:anti-sigma factor RsiW
MLTCKQVTKTIASDELAMATWRHRALVRTHLFRCRHCRRYAAQLRAIGSATRDLFQPSRDEDETLKRLEQTLRGDLPDA